MLYGFLDSDYAGDVVDRKSTRGMAFYLDESLITWVSQKQRCMVLSSCEVEFMLLLLQHVKDYGCIVY